MGLLCDAGTLASACEGLLLGFMTWPQPPLEPSLARTTEGRRSSMPLVSPVPVGQEASSPPHSWRGTRRPLVPLCCSLVEVQSPAGLLQPGPGFSFFQIDAGFYRSSS